MDADVDVNAAAGVDAKVDVDGNVNVDAADVPETPGRSPKPAAATASDTHCTGTASNDPAESSPARTLRRAPVRISEAV